MANSFTPGLKLRQPARGDDLWDDDLNANCDVLEAALNRGGGVCGVIGQGLQVSAAGGLSAAWTAGSCRVNGTKFSPAAGSKTCADNALSFLYVSSGGTVQAATSLPSPPYCALAAVECAGGAVVRVADLRRRLVDGLAEHAEDGTHGLIKPSRLEPRGTDGAYRRSPASGWRDPEGQVNNVVLKNDPTPLIYESGRDSSFGSLYPAYALGSGFVPPDAHGLIVSCRVSDTSAGASSYWAFFPSDALQDDDVRYAAVARVHNNASESGTSFHYQLTFRIGADNWFYMYCYNTVAATAAIRVRLVGWIEPA